MNQSDTSKTAAYVDDIAMQIAERLIATLATTTALAFPSHDVPWAQAVRGACVAAYREGRKHAEAEATLIDDAIAQVDTARTKRLLESAMASTMEAAGLNTLHINLPRAATVHDRCVLTVATAGADVIYNLAKREPAGE